MDGALLTIGFGFFQGGVSCSLLFHGLRDLGDLESLAEKRNENSCEETWKEGGGKGKKERES